MLLLTERFMRKFCGEMGMEPVRIPEKVRMALMDYSWPGNVRELRNVCERACVLLRSGAVKSDMQAAFPMMVVKKAPASGTENGNFRRSVQDFEKQEIAAALQKFSGNKTRAAEYLGISRATLWKKIRELELE